MSRKTLGWLLIAVGIIALIVAFGADAFGLGAVSGFGYKQLALAVVGLLIAVAGAWLTFRKRA